MKIHVLRCFLLAILLSVSVAGFAQTEVWNVRDLWNVRNNLGGSYLQKAHIDLERTDPNILDDYPYADNTNYVVGDIVLYNNYAYYCITAHNSGTSFIPGNWLQMWEWQKGWAPLGTSQTNPFFGVYDGGNFEIRNLYINRGPVTPNNDPTWPYWADGEDNVGLFGFVTNANGSGVATNYHVYVRNVIVKNPRVTGRRGVGAIIGKTLLPVTQPARSYTVYLENSSSQATEGSYVKGFGATGGVIGANNSDGRQRVPVVRLCWSNVNVSSIAPTNTWRNPNDYFGSPRIYNPYNIKYGGLVGCNENGVTQDSYARGNVSGGDRVGGAIGCTIGGSIFRTYGTGDLNRGISPGDWQGGWGGLVGLTSGTLPPGLGGTNAAGSVENGYWLVKAGVTYTTTFTASRTEAQFLDQGNTATNFPNWDFANVWGYVSGVNNNYPILRSSPILEYHYRSTGNGMWNNVATWERSTDNINWSAATLIPDESNSITIMIRSGHTVTTNQNIFVDAMTIASGGKLVIGSGYTMQVDNGLGTDLSIEGELIVTGDFVVGANALVITSINSRIEYNGTSEQSIGSGFPTEVYDLAINNSNGVSISVALQVQGTFYVTEGSYETGASVQIDGLESPAVKFLSFPKTNFNIINYSTTTNTNVSDMQYIKRQWTINGNINSATESNRIKTLQFFWTTDDDYNFNWDTKVPKVYFGAGYAVPTSYSLTGSSRWVKIEYIFPENAKASQNFKIGLDENETLPVQLSSFNAIVMQGTNVMLQWVTMSETNLSGFRVYRGTEDDLLSANLLDAFINGTNTSQTQTYVYYDNDLYDQGTYYYWLESLDFDGSSEFYGPASVIYSPFNTETPGATVVAGLTAIYPNPFNPTTTIRYGVTRQGAVKMDIFNSRGQLVRSVDQGARAVGYHQFVWNGKDDLNRDLGTGVYLIRLSINGESWTQKALLLK